MCLLLQEIKPQKAERDIVCYKVMFNDKKTGAILTPFQMVRPTPDVLSGYVPFKASRSDSRVNELIHEIEKGSAIGRCCPDIKGKVDDGFIHTYMFASHAQDDMGHELFAKKEYLVFRCVIPKGTEYLQGYYGGWPCYASREIKFQGVV